MSFYPLENHRILKFENEIEAPMLNKTAWLLTSLWIAFFIGSTLLESAK